MNYNLTARGEERRNPITPGDPDYGDDVKATNAQDHVNRQDTLLELRVTRNMIKIKITMCVVNVFLLHPILGRNRYCYQTYNSSEQTVRRHRI